MHSFGFDPIADLNARVIVLGSLPGRISLEQQQYYAQPHNAFWKIMGHLFGAQPNDPYQTRIATLKKCNIALWDVCASAYRPGSLDSAISLTTVKPNDIAGFLLLHRKIGVICFNGSKAEALYRRLVIPHLSEAHQGLKYELLPSTSAAHASMPIAEKLRRWSVVRRASMGMPTAIVD